jgi:DNA-binding transcriptional MerR regulator
MWTIDELVERVREALAAEYSGASDGRVRDVPDRRAIRWYTTIGLVDRPLGMRGRTALYGPRHLQQIVAIKRRQAAGRSLSQIQVELSWVSDAVLADVSRVPERLLETDGPDPDDPATAPRTHFWSHAPASPAPGVTARYPQRHPFAEVPARDRISEVATAAPPGSPIAGVALGGGAILLVPHPLSDHDRADIVAAAAPLLDLLEARGLVEGRSA